MWFRNNFASINFGSSHARSEALGWIRYQYCYMSSDLEVTNKSAHYSVLRKKFQPYNSRHRVTSAAQTKYRSPN